MTDPERAIHQALNRLYRNCDADQLAYLGRETIVRGVAIAMKAMSDEELSELLYRIADDLATREAR